MQTHNTFPCLVSIFRNAACWCSAFWLFSTANSNSPQGISFPAMLAAGLLSYLLFRLFLLRPRTVPAVTALGIVLYAGSCIVLLGCFSSLSGFFPMLIAAAAIGILVGRGFFLCKEPISIEKSISGFDLSICFAVFYLGFQNSTKIGFSSAVPLLISVVLGLLAIISQRLSDLGGRSVRGRFRGLPVVAAVTGAVVILLLAFLQFAAEPVSRGVVVLFLTAWKGLKAVGHVLYVFLLWLISFFPATGNMPEQQEPSALPGAAAIPKSELDPAILMIIGGVLLCAATALILYLLHRFRKITFGGRVTVVQQGTVTRRRVSPGGWIRRMLAGLHRRICFLKAAVSMRGSPQFLYWQLARTGSRLGLRKQSAETPSAYLHRLAQILPPDGAPELRDSMEHLAECLDAALYAPDGPSVFPDGQARLIRRSFRALPRRARAG